VPEDHELDSRQSQWLKFLKKIISRRKVIPFQFDSCNGAGQTGGDDCVVEEDEVAGYRIKLLTGPHTGAEVEMDTNDSILTIGSGDGAELLLADALVRPLHAELSCDGGQIFVKQLGGKTFLNGKPLTGEGPTAIGDFQFVTVGTTHMLIGPIDGDWSLHDGDEVPILELDDDEVPREISSKVNMVADQAVLRAARDRVERAARRKKRLKIFAYVVGTIVILFVATCLIPKKKSPNAADTEKIIRSQLAAMGQYPAVSVRADRGQIIVDGYVQTNADLQDLRTIIGTAYPGVHYAVRSQERIISAIDEQLRSLDGRFRVTQLQPGAYAIGGYVYDADTWQKTRSRLTSDVAGVKKIQNDVLTPDQILAMAQEVLSRNGLSRYIGVVPEANRILFHGKISSLQMEQWKSAAEDFIQTFADTVPLDFDVQTLSAQTETSVNAFFPQPIQSITIGSSGLSWVATGDGHKYFIGSFLPSGWRVDAIESDGLSLSREGKRINMRLEALR
jgi:type III secretion system YscD/HrpQ family protein